MPIPLWSHLKQLERRLTAFNESALVQSINNHHSLWCGIHTNSTHGGTIAPEVVFRDEEIFVQEKGFLGASTPRRHTWDTHRFLRNTKLRTHAPAVDDAANTQ